MPTDRSDAAYDLSPSMTALDDGGYVVSWQLHDMSKGNSDTIFRQSYDAAGLPVGELFQAHDDAAESWHSPAIVGLQNGALAVVWSGHGPGVDSGVFGRVFGAVRVAEEVGTSGHDTFSGGDRDNLLVGMAGNDILDGRDGDNILFGGRGAHTFVISTLRGTNTIKDFSLDDGDVLWLDSVLASLLTVGGEALADYLATLASSQ